MLGQDKGRLLDDYVSDYVIYDLETTGVSTKEDAVVEISAVRVMGGAVVDEYTSLVNPGRPIPAHATNVNGITDEMVADAPTFDVVLKEFLEFVGDMILVGHNINTFDMKFLYRDSMEYYGLVPNNDYIDTLRMARKILTSLSNHKLVDLATHYGISTEGAHRALNDCRMNQQVFELMAKEPKPTASESAARRKCPKCGAFLKKRNGMYGSFYGCSAFPRCNYTENC